MEKPRLKIPSGLRVQTYITYYIHTNVNFSPRKLCLSVVLSQENVQHHHILSVKPSPQCLPSLTEHIWYHIPPTHPLATSCCWQCTLLPKFQFTTKGRPTQTRSHKYDQVTFMRRDYFWLFYFQLLDFAPSMPELRQGRKENHFNSNFFTLEINTL